MTNNIFQPTSPKWWQISINHLWVMWVLFSLERFLFYGGTGIFWETLKKIMIKVKSFTGKLQASRLEVFLDGELWGNCKRGALRCCITWTFFLLVSCPFALKIHFKDNTITYKMHVSHVFSILCVFFVLYDFSSF